MKYLEKNNRSVIALICLSFLVPTIMKAQLSITSTDYRYTQDFNSLATGASGSNMTWTNNSTLAGWYMDYQGSTINNYNFQVVPKGDVGGGVTSGGISDNRSARFFNIGHADDSNRAVGMARTYSTYGAIGTVFQNNSGSALSSFTLGYSGQQWRREGTTETALYFEYLVMNDVSNLDIISDPSNWQRVSALQFNSPKFDGGGTDLDGIVHKATINSAEINVNIGISDYLVMRWYQDRSDVNGDPTTVDHALSIDDVNFSVTAVPEPSGLAIFVGFLALGVALSRCKRR